MPFIRNPRTDMARLDLLKEIRSKGQEDITAGNPYLYQSFVDDIQRFVNQLEPKLNDLNNLRHARGAAVSQKNTTMVKLERTVRDFWEGLERRIMRNEEDVTLLDLYGMSRDGNNPADGTEQEWVDWSKELIDGDADAVAAGKPAMCNPSAAELDALYNAARRQRRERRQADTQLDEMQHAIDALRPRADTLIRLASDQLDAALADLPADDVRHIKRNYGFIYAYRTGEEPEDDSDVPADDEEGGDESSTT